mmetsp:Transcript_28525/g.61140  ORF Transcript_28525/g.61140 Transcript_28525/m.61140 type:complete len:202 (+) Transcript_28525:105-710(+)|eukprot:CAMPEP_0201123880 /NCGR_PEP_ID=MMETSP0850-20130426/9153_1 /ASSEMBLY_ACC=CAM_ASM_000622 /TAXON_ID=183588 /ORGANISM="Pseudo-nitzschia fraudulenta, Strain WWA7" /LENGTH=201 /DNA_ID=CAMNT_0047390989 /DNA_START=54 /DNA_END=659 /DNA_ORIENTATION=-
MTVFNSFRMCIVAALVCKANAFTAAPPVVIDVPESAVVSSLPSASQMQTFSSNLPSQRELLDKVGSLTIASAAAPKSTNMAAGAGISIADIRYDGAVPKTESDEYVLINNSSKDAVDVSGYFIYPATSGTQGSTFYFPKGSLIKPNSSVRIYTNEIHKETGGYSWGSGKALWSNKGGLAILKDSNGKKLGEYKYVPPANSA